MHKFFKKFGANDKMNVDVPFTCKQVTENDEGYIFEGYASVFGVIDSDDDIIARGAYAESLTKRMPKVLGHHDVYMPVGVTLEAKEDEQGLWVRGFIPKDGGNTPFIVPYLKIGAIDSLSVGFRIARDADGRPQYDIINGIRVINKIELYEYSFVVFPANEFAKVTLTGEKSDNVDAELLKALNDCLTLGEPQQAGDKRVQVEVKFDAAKFAQLTKSHPTPSTVAGSDDVADLPIAEGSVGWDPVAVATMVKDMKEADRLKIGVRVGDEVMYFGALVDGQLKAVRRGVVSCAKAVAAKKGQEGYDAAVATLNKYYAALGEESPFQGEQPLIADIDALTDLKGLAALLKFHGFSNKEYNALVAKLKELLGGRNDPPNHQHDDGSRKAEADALARMAAALDEHAVKTADRMADRIMSQLKLH